jgi:hypothetical protein
MKEGKEFQCVRALSLDLEATDHGPSHPRCKPAATRSPAFRLESARSNDSCATPGFAASGVHVSLISRRGKACKSRRVPTWARRRCTVSLARCGRLLVSERWASQTVGGWVDPRMAHASSSAQLAFSRGDLSQTGCGAGGARDMDRDEGVPRHGSLPALPAETRQLLRRLPGKDSPGPSQR